MIANDTVEPQPAHLAWAAWTMDGPPRCGNDAPPRRMSSLASPEGTRVLGNGQRGPAQPVGGGRSAGRRSQKAGLTMHTASSQSHRPLDKLVIFQYTVWQVAPVRIPLRRATHVAVLILGVGALASLHYFAAPGNPSLRRCSCYGLWQGGSAPTRSSPCSIP